MERNKEGWMSVLIHFVILVSITTFYHGHHPIAEKLYLVDQAYRPENRNNPNAVMRSACMSPARVDSAWSGTNLNWGCFITANASEVREMGLDPTHMAEYFEE